MPTQDGFHPNHPLPVFLADQPEQQGIGIARDGAFAPWRALKASILIAIATAIGIAVLWGGNPVNLFANVTASLVDNLGLQPPADQSTPKTQSTAEALPPTARDTPARNEIAASDPAGQDQTEKSEPSSEALFRQFQAWAAEKEPQADVRPVQPVQDTPAQAVPDAPARVVQDARAQTENTPAQAAENARINLRIMQERRRVQPVHNARAEMRVQNPRKKVVRRVQNARVQGAPAQDARAEAARAQGQPVQNPETPSFLQTFGARN